MVGLKEELGAGGGFVGAEAGEERRDAFHGLGLVVAAHDVPAFGGLRAGVGDEDGVDVGHDRRCGAVT